MSVTSKYNTVQQPLPKICRTAKEYWNWVSVSFQRWISQFPKVDKRNIGSSSLYCLNDGCFFRKNTFKITHNHEIWYLNFSKPQFTKIHKLNLKRNTVLHTQPEIMVVCSKLEVGTQHLSSLHILAQVVSFGGIGMHQFYGFHSQYYFGGNFHITFLPRHTNFYCS